jgi:ribosomal-protein-alanine N-acetyltransferase
MTPTIPKLETTRLDLIPTTLEHLRVELESPERLGEVLQAVVPAGWPPGLYDHGAMRYFQERLLELGDVAEGWFGWYAILRPTNPGERLLVGAVGYMGPPAPDGSVEIGYSIAPEARGQGYASEIVGALADRALRASGVHRVVAETHESNTPSIRALERNAFARVGPGREPEHIRFERQR